MLQPQKKLQKEIEQMLQCAKGCDIIEPEEQRTRRTYKKTDLRRHGARERGMAMAKMTRMQQKIYDYIAGSRGILPRCGRSARRWD